MRRNHLPVILSFILLVITACSLTIAEVPYWMTGDWEIYSETGEYIGRCEIDTHAISVTIDSFTYETFDLLERAMQNGGWTENTSTDTYIIYDGTTLQEAYTFIKDGGRIILEIGNDGYKTILTLI